MGERQVGADYTKKAYDLRDRASEVERFYIDSHYFENVNGDLDKTIQVYQSWIETYPRDTIPRNNLGVAYQQLGQGEKALSQGLDALRMGPDESIYSIQVGASYLALGRLDECKATLNQAISRKIDVPWFHRILYQVAFVQNDAAEMERQLAVMSSGSPDAAAFAIWLRGDSEAYAGHLKKAQELLQRASAAFETASGKESAAAVLTDQAFIEAQMEDAAAAKKDAAAALAMDSSFNTRIQVAYVLARAGDTARAESIAAELTKARPNATLANKYDLPVIGATVDLDRNNPAKAVEALRDVVPYDLGFRQRLLSVYTRGRAFLANRQGTEAAAEFQKILDHPGIVQNGFVGGVARLGLARAYALQGDSAKAKVAYQDFFALWKDADPEIPILKEAKTEYARLK
jgi:tetratricopeptide (TPR) repeat protein